MPLRVKVAAALHALNLDPADVQWDHDPPLQLRVWDEKTKDTIPPANDPKHIVPRAAAAHRAKTNGPATKARAQGDKTEIAKTRRLAERQAALRQSIDTKKPGAPRASKSRMKSRPFPKGKRPLGKPKGKSR